MTTEDSAAERALIEKVKSRDTEALGQFLENNRGRMGGFIRSITGEHLLAVIDIDDLLQEVFTTAITSLPTAPLDQYEPIAWVQQIARRRVVDAHRFHFDAKQRDANRQQSLQGGGSDASAGFEALLAASITSPSAAVSRDLRMTRTNEAIGSLSDEQQTAIRMRYAEGKSTKEIAGVIGKTDVATRVLLSRSMRQLESLLEDVRPTR